MIKLAIILSVTTVLLLLLTACGSGGKVDPGKVIKSATVNNNLTVTISNPDGALKNTDGEFVLSFKDGSGKTVDVGAASLKFYMPPMGTMPAMNSQATLSTTDSPGVYRGEAKFEAAGEWQAQVAYEGPAGRGQTSFSVMVQ